MKLIDRVNLFLMSWRKAEAKGIISNGIYMHEAGHTVIAKLFNDVFTLNFLTVDKELSGRYDKGSLGALNGSRVRRGQEYTLEEASKTILIFLAGYCTELVIEFKGCLPKKVFTEEYTQQHLMTEGKYSGDVELIEMLYWNVVRPLTAIPLSKYRLFCIKRLCELLKRDMVWGSIVDTANNLRLQDSKTLNGQQLDNIFDKNGLTDWANRSSILIAALPDSIVTYASIHGKYGIN